MTLQPVEIVCATEGDTARLGETLAMALRAGDLVTLSGDLGAGKTVLARATIRAAAGETKLEVPSPTFTLVQIYDGLPFGNLAHLDLYRLSDGSELNELGLDDALETGAALIEWPERAANDLGDATLAIRLEPEENDSRLVTITGDESAMARLQRSLDIRAFLDANGHQTSSRDNLTGDASTRAYETIHPENDGTLILMNSPAQPDGPPVKDGKPYSTIAHLAEDVGAFVGVDILLRERGFRAPKILVQDLDAGLLLIEHLGDEFIIDETRKPIPERYEAAIDTLAAMHRFDWPNTVSIAEGRSHTIPDFDYDAMMIEVSLLVGWYAPRRLGRPLNADEHVEFDTIWNGLTAELESVEKTLVLRDYHSPNIVWDDTANGTDRTGLIDFQDALIGPSAYDVASLAQDARVDVSADLEKHLLDRYCTARGDFDEACFRAAYAIMAAERATKVLGIFVRLSQRDGKHDYLAHLTRIEGYLSRSFIHPALADYEAWFNEMFDGTKA
ncbi:MAG: tRNA (adenosine(37)-N6)-threonylcarbamoyltransferase complex ATPase subunit type 1 TsaE [Rhizobiaceae bacterium]